MKSFVKNRIEKLKSALHFANSEQDDSKLASNSLPVQICILSIIALFSITRSALSNSYIEEPVRQNLPPILTYVPENNVLTLIETNFFLNHRKRTTYSSLKKAQQDYNKLLKTYNSQIENANDSPVDELEKTFYKAADLYLFYTKIDFLGTYADTMDELRKVIYKIGEWVYLKSDKKKTKNYIKTLYLASGLSQPAHLGESVSKLAEQHKKAPKNFRKSIGILLYYNLSSSGATSKSAKLVLGRKTKLTRFESALLALINIERKLEIGEVFSSSRQVNKIMQKLYKISSSIQSIRSPGIRWQLNHTILYLWMRVQKNLNWTQAPLYEIKNGKQQLILPIVERLLIEDIKRGDIAAGIKGYRRLSQNFKNSVLSTQLDLRYLYLAEKFFQRTGNAAYLGSVYVELERRYRKANPKFPKKSKQTYTQIFLRYRNSIKAIQDSALEGRNTKAQKLATTLAQQFTQTYKNLRPEILDIKVRLAELYYRVNMHQLAVREFLDLSKDQPLKNYQQAARSQRVLANWPDLPPWKRIPEGIKQERLELLKLYNAIVAIQLKSSKPSWVDLGHLGLLLRATGNEQAAEKLWAKALLTAEASTHSNAAAGIVLATYLQQKRWTDFINLTRLCSARQIIPTLNAKVMDVRKLYQVALLNRGNQLSKEGKRKDAIKDFEEFIKDYRQHPNRYAVIIEASRLHKAEGNLLSSLSFVELLIKDYPNSRATKSVIIESGRWARQSKDENVLKAISNLYKFFVENYPNDPNIREARFEWAKVLMTMKEFNRAASVLKQHALDRKAKPVERVQSALTFVNLERRFGEGDKAIVEVIPVIKMIKVEYGEQNFVLAHTILAQVASEQLDIPSMKREIGILTPYLGKYQEVAEAVGFMKYTLAERSEFEIPFPNQRFGIEVYKAKLDEIFAIFTKIKSTYEDVCKPIDNTYCQNAYERLGSISQDAADAMGAVELESGVQESMKETLLQTRQDYLKKIGDDISKFQDLAGKYRAINKQKSER